MTIQIQNGSFADKAERKELLLIAGWIQTKLGWTHFHIGGLHNMKSAEKITNKWIEE